MGFLEKGKELQLLMYSRRTYKNGINNKNNN